MYLEWDCLHAQALFRRAQLKALVDMHSLDAGEIHLAGITHALAY